MTSGGSDWGSTIVSPANQLLTRPFYYTTLAADPTNANVVYGGAEGFFNHAPTRPPSPTNTRPHPNPQRNPPTNPTTTENWPAIDQPQTTEGFE